MGRSRINKKAMEAEQFNWIFVLVAGTVILIFFITIVQKQRAISDTKLAASIRTDISTILTGAGVTPDTTNVLTMPQTAISFSCDDQGYSDFEIAKTGVNKKTPFDVIFAPDNVKGPNLITWAKEFKMPFKVMNFLYLTDAQVRYILVFSPGDQLAEKIESELPDQINKEAVFSASGLTDKNNYKVKFVFFGNIERNAAYTFRNMADKDVTAIKISEASIEFYKKTGEYFTLQGIAPYIQDQDDTFIYGAIFSEDKIFFECNLKKVIKRLGYVSRIFADRESDLKSSAGPNCVPYYYGKLEEMAGLLGQCSNTVESCNYNQLNFVAGQIKQNHDQALAYHTECPQIY